MNRNRLEAALECLPVIQSGAGHAEVEDSHDPGIQNTAKRTPASGQVFAGDPSLFVGCGSQPVEHGLIRNQVDGFGSIAGRKNARHGCLQFRSDRDRPRASERNPGRFG